MLCVEPVLASGTEVSVAVGCTDGGLLVVCTAVVLGAVVRGAEVDGAGLLVWQPHEGDTGVTGGVGVEMLTEAFAALASSTEPAPTANKPAIRKTKVARVLEPRDVTRTGIGSSHCSVPESLGQ